MSDISAVVLSMGETTTQRTLDSLKTQSSLPEEVILVKHVTPFHRALNMGASKVKTEFFVQVDSDMIPDPNCFESLRECMTEDVGIAVGHLRDPLVGRTVGIKMFRKRCFEKVKFPDTISPDTDFRDRILRGGWKCVYVLGFNEGSPNLWHTFGEHQPNYTANYTYSKYLLEGKRYVYRNDSGGFRAHFRKLHKSTHSAALLAEVAMAHGIFLGSENDLLRPYGKQEEVEFLQVFLAGEGGGEADEFDLAGIVQFNPDVQFRDFYRLGIRLRAGNSPQGFKGCIDKLKQAPEKMAWVAIVALCHGLLSEKYEEGKFRDDYAMFRNFLKA